MQKFKKLFISLTLLAIPVLAFAQEIKDGLVPCDNVTKPCDWTQLMYMVNLIIHFILFYMAIPIAAIMFLYAGFELVTSGGSTEKRGTAKKVFTNAVIGLVLAAACWLIIRIILTILGFNGDWIGF